MNKNITIQEGGIGKQMSVSKIKTNKVGGGTVLWIPEDSATLKTKSVSKNWTYKAQRDDDCYGYSEVTVSVKGGNGSAKKDGTPTTENGVEPGDIGSAVIGVNPTTGNEEAVGIDENGKIVVTPLPSYIEIGKDPNKMSYVDGETIDLTGIIVVAKKADGTGWANASYPNGRISASELTVDPTTVDASKVSQRTYTTYTNGQGINALRVACSIEDRQGYICPDILGSVGDNSYTIASWGFGEALITRYNDDIYYLGISGTLSVRIARRVDISSTYPNGWYVFGSSNYTTRLDEWSDNGQFKEYLNLIPESTVQPTGDISSLNPTGGTQTITVKWQRFGDKKELSTTMEVEVTAAGSGYSDNSGSSQSGGGGGF